VIQHRAKRDFAEAPEKPPRCKAQVSIRVLHRKEHISASAECPRNLGISPDPQIEFQIPVRLVHQGFRQPFRRLHRDAARPIADGVDLRQDEREDGFGLVGAVAIEKLNRDLFGAALNAAMMTASSAAEVSTDRM
jgi:hypothetical protein